MTGVPLTTQHPSLDALTAAIGHQTIRYGRPARVIVSPEYLTLLLHEARTTVLQTDPSRSAPFYVDGVQVVEDLACRAGRIHFEFGPELSGQSL